MKIEKGTSYRIYGKVEGMKRMKPLSGDTFTTNLIYAEIFTPASNADCEKLRRELAFLNAQGSFELRKVSEF